MREPNIVNMLFGSHLYGLDTPNSDLDYKGIYLPELDELLLGNYAKQYKFSTGDDKSRNKAGDIDSEVVALPTFIKFACEGETFAIDMLHTNATLSSSDIWEDLVNNRTKFYSKNLKAFVGYVRKQAAKYGVKGSRLAVIEEALTVATLSSAFTLEDVFSLLPAGEYSRFVTTEHPTIGEQVFYEICGRKFQSTIRISMFKDQLQRIYDSYGARAQLAKDNSGIDWKAVSHALRAGYQVRDIYRYGDFEYPLKETTFLLQVKTGTFDYTTQVAPILEELVSEIDMLAEKSNLPDKVDRNYWDQWLLNVYKEKYGV